MDPCDDPDDILRANRSREKQYVFDTAFGPAATQVSAFVVALLSDSVSQFCWTFPGVTLLAYGITTMGF